VQVNVSRWSSLPKAKVRDLCLTPTGHVYSLDSLLKSMYFSRAVKRVCPYDILRDILTIL